MQKNKEYIKHCHYMTEEERVYLMFLRDKACKNIQFAYHALDRMNERWIKEKDVVKAIQNGQIVEYKHTSKDDILTIRGCTLNRKREQVIVIFSIKTGKVITTYSNKYWIARNKSSELDKYTNDVKIWIPKYFKEKYKMYH